jgi:hypothetical protein
VVGRIVLETPNVEEVARPKRPEVEEVLVKADTEVAERRARTALESFMMN